MWWAWASYSWLTNAVPAHEAIVARLIVLSAMVAMLVASLAAPGAFGEYGVIFGVSYFVVRLSMVALYVPATGGTPEARRAILRLAPGGPALFVVAGFLNGFVQGALWTLALAIDYGGPLIFGVAGFWIHASTAWSVTASQSP